MAQTKEISTGQNDKAVRSNADNVSGASVSLPAMPVMQQKDMFEETDTPVQLKDPITGDTASAVNNGNNIQRIVEPFKTVKVVENETKYFLNDNKPAQFKLTRAQHILQGANNIQVFKPVQKKENNTGVNSAASQKVIQLNRWGVISTLAAAGGAAAGYALGSLATAAATAFGSAATGAAVGSVAPGFGTAIGAGIGLIGAGIGYMRSGSSTPAPSTLSPEEIERRKSITDALTLYTKLRDGVNTLDLPETSIDKQGAVLEQINSRIVKLGTLATGAHDTDNWLVEILGWIGAGQASLRNLVTASRRKQVPDSKEAVSISSPQPKKKASPDVEIDDVIRGLIELKERGIPKPAPKLASSSSSSSGSSALKPYSVRRQQTLDDVEGEFNRWAASSKSKYNMNHSGLTLSNGPYSALEKQDIRNAIHNALQTWIGKHSFINNAKVLHGKSGKGENFNIGAYDSKNKQVINMHFLW